MIADLVDFDKELIEQLASNLHHPGGTDPDPNPDAAPGAMDPTPPFVFGAKSQKRLMIACDLVQYYNTVGHDYTPARIAVDTYNEELQNPVEGPQGPEGQRNSGGAEDFKAATDYQVDILQGFLELSDWSPHDPIGLHHSI